MEARYGPWAVVAGASEGLGAAFAGELARRGFNLVLVARREEILRELAEDLQGRTGAENRVVVGDLALEETLRMVAEVCDEVDVGLLVYNAAAAPRGDFAGTGVEELRGAVAVNVAGPVELVHRLLPLFARRSGAPDGGAAERRAGIILMSSLAGDQGSPGVVTYAAGKAFTTVLGQGLWYELRPQGIDVTVCVAGAVRTPGLAAAREAGADEREAPGTLDPDAVVRAALAGLGRRAVVVPGVVNRLARFVMRRLLPSRAAVAIMASSTRQLTQATREHTDG
ncbi:MAG: SDR family NAD(P)-dependent oxidoreductase [Spirochaetaceae bacterium]